MYGLTRAGTTLIGAAAAGFLFWVGTRLVEAINPFSFQGTTKGDYWLWLLTLAAAGFVMALSQLLGGLDEVGVADDLVPVLVIGFVPPLVVGLWILGVSNAGPGLGLRPRPQLVERHRRLPRRSATGSPSRRSLSCSGCSSASPSTPAGRAWRGRWWSRRPDPAAGATTAGSGCRRQRTSRGGRRVRRAWRARRRRARPPTASARRWYEPDGEKHATAPTIASAAGSAPPCSLRPGISGAVRGADIGYMRRRAANPRADSASAAAPGSMTGRPTSRRSRPGEGLSVQSGRRRWRLAGVGPVGRPPPGVGKVAAV